MERFLNQGSGVQYIPVRLFERRLSEEQPPTGWQSLPDFKGVSVCIRWRGRDTYLMVRVNSDKIESGTRIDLDASTIGGTIPEFERKAEMEHLVIHVPKNPRLVDVYLVVDFGNTSSAVIAVVLDNQDPQKRIIELQLADRFAPEADDSFVDVRRQAIIPSFVLYEQCGTPEQSRDGRRWPEVSIGETARRRQVEVAAFDHNYCASPKRVVFDKRPFGPVDLDGQALWPLPDPDEEKTGWAVRDAAVLYLRELFLAAMESLNCLSEGRRPKYCIRGISLTVPVSFTQDEIRSLEWVAQRAAKYAELGLPKRGMPSVLCDEATAVANFYVQNLLHDYEGDPASLLEVPESSRPIRLMVVDVGGATSDVAIDDFEWSNGIETTRVHADGGVFGGDDLSVELIRGLAREVCVRGRCRCPEEVEPSLDDDTLTPRVVALGLLRRYHAFAEELKRRSADVDNRALAVRLDDGFLDISNANLMANDPFEHLEEHLDNFVRGRFYSEDRLRDLELSADVVEHWCRTSKCVAMVNHWVMLMDEHQPDVLVLSGMTSRLPLIHDELHKAAEARGVKLGRLALQLPTIRSTIALEKSAVSLGAAIAVAGRHGGEGVGVVTHLPERFRAAPRCIHLLPRGGSSGPLIVATAEDHKKYGGENRAAHMNWPKDQNQFEVLTSFSSSPSAPTILAGRIQSVGSENVTSDIPVKLTVELTRPESLSVEVDTIGDVAVQKWKWDFEPDRDMGVVFFKKGVKHGAVA